MPAVTVSMGLFFYAALFPMIIVCIPFLSPVYTGVLITLGPIRLKRKHPPIRIQSGLTQSTSIGGLEPAS